MTTPAHATFPLDAPLDAPLGLAPLGMIVVHFHQRLERPVGGAEDLLAWAVWVLVEQTAWGTFALLFGVVAQLGLGFQILLAYAAWGVVLLLVRRWSTRALLALAALAACAGPALTELAALHAWRTGAPAAAAAGVARWRGLLPDSNLALFVLGLLAVRHRVLDEPLRRARLIRGWMAFGALSWGAWWLALRNLPALPTPEIDWPVRHGLGLVREQWLCLTYVGAVVLLLARRPAWAARLAPFAWAGRMALTDSMLQATVFA